MPITNMRSSLRFSSRISTAHLGHSGMDALGPQTAEPLCETLTSKQDDLSALFSAALDGECKVEEAKVVTEEEGWRDALNQTALTVGMVTSQTGVVLALPKSLIANAESAASDKKWRTFGDGLQANFVAEHFSASSVQVTAPEDASYVASSMTDDAACLEITLQFGDAEHQAYLVLPLAHLILLFTEPPPEEVPTAADFGGEDEAEDEFVDSAAEEETQAAASHSNEAPDFGHSLMQIKLPVMVSLARKKLEIKHILEIAPGSLIQFDKFCEDLLDVEAAEHKIARGEAVKVGDKFGIRITALVQPAERFVTVQKEEQ